MDSFQVYRDMKARTNGEIYIGVVGPVRTGKSTFIKRFMDLLVLPNMTDEHARERTKDELPQSASGTTIMTTEPKFVPKEAASVRLSDDVEVKIRLIDCVGFMVEGASGHIENDTERQVKTPWFEYEIPFTKAAAIGTQKVIHDHATIGFVVTTDGSVTDLPRENYIEAEEKTVRELKTIGKPFLILLNCKKPYSEETRTLQNELEQKYGASVVPVNCEQMKPEDIHEIMRQVLYEFPITEAEFYIPKWVEMLSREHRIKKDLLEQVRSVMTDLEDVRSIVAKEMNTDSSYIKDMTVEQIEMDTGKVRIQIRYEQSYYYEVLSELTGTQIKGEYELISTVKELASMREELSSLKDAFTNVKMKGYGVVTPSKEDIRLEEPVIIKQGSKFGVKIRSEAPSIHMIRANIETEIAPIVGSEKQAQDLADYIKKESETPEGVWGTNIFGKTVEELVMDGMKNKIAMIGDESQIKLQDSMQKIVNDTNGGLVCIII
ncbi:stage IV sporulation protein A [Mediterraneibacter glycyrrhizinilyticus]|uniref:stage IV sporulation protein A n=1 Tax=Mediterraneibacter glycyrrhizinilyticus TaxID=342942 RepID=UPI0025A4363F|nr:stage IV sporulation protein A [Mediterraneibacter glycyrrhizinilyticus]MDM8211880.1 stage IV sporulation protein A [Mediterraneibacter glycyrrhizinilyticus]